MLVEAETFFCLALLFFCFFHLFLSLLQSLDLEGEM